MAQCVSCGAGLTPGQNKCLKCGTVVDAAPAPAQQPVGQPQVVYVQQAPVVQSNKSRSTAGILAILLGGLGVHKFYLGSSGMGILYLIFVWTGIPSIAGIIEGIMYLTMSDQAFAQKYGNR
jgi:TM2 domain-containing membrane protein YozV